MAETRKGFAFGRPDTTSDHHAPGFGLIITPDELRYVYGFGNELTAPNCDTITDETLQWYVDNALASVERDLNVKIAARKYFFRDAVKPRDDIPDNLRPDIDFEFEEPSDFFPKYFKEYIYIKMRRRPILTVGRAEFRDLAGGLIIDLVEFGMKINYERGSIQFFPNSGTLATLPLFVGASYPLFQYSSSRGEYPDAYFIDYEAGFKNVLGFRRKWGELVNIIGMLAAIYMLNDYGDGKSPGIASSSISLSGISESFSTTQSATNALYGARILNYTNQIKAFYAASRSKYSGILLGAL